jgi:hypothetical protein
MARALVGHLSERKPTLPTDIIEKLGQLGIQVSVRSGSQHTETKTTKEFHERMTQRQGEDVPIPCFVIINGQRACWTPIWDLFPPRKLNR